MERAYTFDNSMAFQQPLHLDAPPFTHGKWSITFAALPRTSNTSQPSGWCRISWSGAEPAEVYRIALAVKCPGGETMEYDLLGGAARFPQFGEGELTRLLPGCAAYVEPPVLEVSSRKLQKKGKKAAFASWMDVNDSYTLKSPWIPLDVRLSFPATGRELHANAELLGFHSDHLRALFGPSTAHGLTESKPNKLYPTSPLEELDDSDRELDKPLLAESTSRPTNPGDAEDVKPDIKTLRIYDPAVHEIVVTDFAYTTYRAVLLFLQTGRIDFAPLSSLAQEPEAVPIDDPFSPPVSPKSVYRLAHHLNLTHLASLALASFTAQLTVQNVASELWSELAEMCEEIRLQAFAFAIAHSAEVVESAGFKEVERRAKLGAHKKEVAAMVGFLGSLRKE